jgi:hypothetical protein
MGLPEVFTTSALAVGPALIGQAISQAGGYGSIGGAAGAEAGMKGLETFEKV